MAKDIEYFDIPIDYCWMVNRSHKPNKSNIDKKKIQLKRGYHKTIINKKINQFNDYKKKIYNFGEYDDDFNRLAEVFVEKIMVISILKQKGIINGKIKKIILK